MPIFLPVSFFLAVLPFRFIDGIGFNVCAVYEACLGGANIPPPFLYEIHAKTCTFSTVSTCGGFLQSRRMYVKIYVSFAHVSLEKTCYENL